MHKNAYKKVLDNNLSCASLFGCMGNFELKKEQVVFVDDGNKIDFGFVQVKAMYFPGHTNCSMLYQIDKMIFCGDVLFPMSVGRNDLPTGNIVSLTDSLKRIKKMEHDIMMYPGHDEVFLLSDALKFNPYLK
jgi:glyoxylase-like metal-dependent hydrolase (beta-lactamase superfamily II)